MMLRTFFLLFLSFVLLMFPGVSFAGWDSLFSKLGFNQQTALSDTKIGSGLKEALKVGVDKTVQLTGKKDGYFANQAIKILMPEKLKTADTLLRKVGLAPQLDEFVLSMNRAAEKAAPYAKDIFIQSIADMSFEDVQGIYKGGDTAATEYFRAKTSAKLAQTYLPIVEKAMGDYAVTTKYQQIVTRYQSLPLASQLKAPDIKEYVVNKALAGLFKTLGEEEKKIRTDPAARVTTLLQEVFKS